MEGIPLTENVMLQFGVAGMMLIIALAILAYGSTFIIKLVRELKAPAPTSTNGASRPKKPSHTLMLQKSEMRQLTLEERVEKLELRQEKQGNKTEKKFREQKDDFKSELALRDKQIDKIDAKMVDLDKENTRQDQDLSKVTAKVARLEGKLGNESK